MTAEIVEGQEKEVKNRHLRIGLMGIPASGKTTLAEKLQEKWGDISMINERPEANPYLRSFYLADPKRWAFHSQFWFAEDKISMLAKEYIVVTSKKDFKSARNNTYTATAQSIKDALKRVKKSGEKEVFIIGGSEIFNQTISLADKIYLTLVKGDFNCDTFFPDYARFKKVIYSKKSIGGEYDFEFKVLEMR